MIEFKPSDPFPILPDGQFTYHDEQVYSESVDAWLGLQTRQVEETLTKNFDRDGSKERDERYWIGLPVQTLLTPYPELRSILEKLNVRAGVIADLGAGYGRMGFVIARYFPGVSFLGLEVVNERVAEGARALSNFVAQLPVRGGTIELRHADLATADFAMPDADIYFLYDYGSARAIEKTLFDLQNVSLRSPITVVGRGRATRDAIERRHPWLSQVNQPAHFAHFSIYKS